MSSSSRLMDNVRTWTPAAGAASAALAFSLLLPMSAYLGFVALSLVVAVAAIVLIVQAESPFLGFAILLVSATAFPLEFPGPSRVMMNTPFLLAAFVCGIWLMHATLARGSAALGTSRVVWALLAFMAVTLLSFAGGQFLALEMGGAPLPAQVAQLGLFLLSGFLFLAVGHQLRDLRHLKWLTWMFIAAGSFACVMQMSPVFNAVARWTTRPGSVGSLFWTWLAAMSLAQALFNRRLGAPARLALLSLDALILYHGLVQVSSWVSGWLPVVTALGIITLMRFPRLSFGLAVLAVPAGLLLGGTALEAVLMEEAYSLTTRQAAWNVLWQIFEGSPLIGTGPANYYYAAENLPLLGWYVRFFSHNNYQDLLLQTGIVGFLVFFWFVVEILRMMFRMYRGLPEGFAKAYVVGALGGLAGSLAAGMLGDWIIPFYYNAGILGFRSSLLFWVFLGGILVLKRVVADQAGAEAPAYAAGAWDPRGELPDAHEA